MTDIERTIEEAKNGMLPFRSWEKLEGESSEAFAAFCTYRDIKIDRSIIGAVELTYTDKKIHSKKYGVWRNWAGKFKWRERAEGYDRHLEILRQEEVRKTIEAQGELHREVAGKMLNVAKKKLDLMNPEELTQGNLTSWVETAVKVHRDDASSYMTELIAPNGKQETKQGELNFVSDFQGL